MKRKIAAILAADIAQYSRLVAEHEEEAVTRLASYREVFGDFVKKAGGRVFNTAGDAVLAEFSSAVEATRCAIDIQESMRTRNMPFPPDRQMLFRIGITIGDVFERGDDLLGDGVNIAARLESIAPAGGICVSRGVYEQVANKISVHFRDIGNREVKNIPQPVHAFMIEMNADPNLSRRTPLPRQTPRGRGPWASVAAGGVIAVFAAGAAIGVLRWVEQTAPPPQTPQPPQTTQQTPPTQPPQTTADADTAPASQEPGGAGTSIAALVPPDVSPAEAFAILAKSGGLVQDPKTVAEFYHNARSYEQRGDSASARRAYLGLMTLGTEAVDAHLRFAALLRAVDGRAGAREVYDRLAETQGLQIAPLIQALSFDGDERRRRIESFVASHADFAPAHLMLADELTESRLGTQTLSDRRRELDALDRFLAADREGRLSAFFLDQSMLGDWLDRARRRQASLEASLSGAVAQPTAKFMRSGSGWTVAISLPEAATALSWRFGEVGKFISTGQLNFVDQRTGRQSPNSTFELAVDTGPGNLWIAYDDAAGRPQGPFPIAFDPRGALVEGQRELLDRFWNSWISFGSDRRLLYYTYLLSYRCGLAGAKIGFDDAPVETALPLPPCDLRDPLSIPGDARPYLPLPAQVKSVSVRLTYANGDVSDVRTFRKP